MCACRALFERNYLLFPVITLVTHLNDMINYFQFFWIQEKQILDRPSTTYLFLNPSPAKGRGENIGLTNWASPYQFGRPKSDLPDAENIKYGAPVPLAFVLSMWDFNSFWVDNLSLSSLVFSPGGPEFLYTRQDRPRSLRFSMWELLTFGSEFIYTTRRSSLFPFPDGGMQFAHFEFTGNFHMWYSFVHA